jgi:large subunit ribosomal protein L34
MCYTAGQRTSSKKSELLIMPKRTYQPKKRHRSKVHGFMKRMSSRAGKLVLKRRRNKGRTKLSS